MLNNNEKRFINILEEAQRCVKGELELDNFDGKWFAMDYREDVGCAFAIMTHGFNEPIITDEYAKSKGVDIIKCCNEIGIAYVG